MRILFLDDDPTRHETFKRLSIGHEVDHVHTAKEAITALGKKSYDLASLDHDLGGRVFVESDDEEGTGYTVAKAIAAKTVPAPREVIVHSFNPVGAMNMAKCLHDAGVRVRMAAFGTWSL